ncbi:DUF2155 domain-containing protein [Phenylobacterium sp.]|uniref:DUF2155 domain-containing protein n=1 Tax=Phenylobacterium sp. TaxID=1871053 RepID=UPI0030F3B32B
MARRLLLSLTAGFSVLVAAGFVAAQTAPVAPTAPVPTPAPVAPSPLPAANQPQPAEEAPPAIVPVPTPVSTPPVQASEVAPATPPKAQAVDKPAESTIKRARYDVAIIQALDKVSAETVRFEAAVGQPVRYKTLVFTVKACEQAAADEPQEDAIAYMTVDSQPRAAPGKPTPPARQAFKGWMYSSSPGLHPLQHPVYDAWLITCRTATPVVAAGSR